MTRTPGNLAILAAFIRAIANGQQLIQLWRAYGKIRAAENVNDFRAGLIQFARALETCYNEPVEVMQPVTTIAEGYFAEIK